MAFIKESEKLQTLSGYKVQTLAVFDAKTTFRIFKKNIKKCTK